MAERSKRINLYNPEKMAQVNPETMMLLNKYGIDVILKLAKARIDTAMNITRMEVLNGLGLNVTDAAEEHWRTVMSIKPQTYGIRAKLK